MLLSHLGVESLLVSRYPETSRYPKAHVLNQRSMEIFTDIGVAPAILEHSAPTENLRGVGWYSGLSGDGPGGVPPGADPPVVRSASAWALGLELDARGFGMGVRGQRFALVVDNGVATQVFVEAPGEFKVSTAEHVLSQL